MSQRYYFGYDDLADVYDVYDSYDHEVVKTYYTYEAANEAVNILNQEDEWNK